jgi:alpha-beta hydrolase superfamily lysophospholipase
VYSTTHMGKPVEASGLIMVPVGMKDKAPIVSLQHGTTFEKDEAPSVRGGFQGMEFFASAGYVTLMPDYLGYGKSASLFHPYYDRKHSASTVIDLIKAAKEFLASEGMSVSDKLFLAGYSEGGYVTLAAAKEMDTNPDHGLKASAVAAGAGGYDLPEMLRGITTGTYYAYPSYLAFVLMAYNHTYEWNKPLNYFFKDRYAEALSKYLNGQYSGGYINSRLTTDVPALFNPSFFEGLHNPEGELELKSALMENSVAGWKTDVRIRMFHGTRDEIIPYHNSEITLDKFRAAGSENVSLTLIQGGTHGNSFERMLGEFIPWFLSLEI